MKKLLLVAALLGATALAGCASTPIVTPATPTSGPVVSTGDPALDAKIAAAQAAAVKACGFLPTYTTVSNILLSFVPGAQPVNAVVTAVANSICNAVSPSASRMARRGASGPPAVSTARGDVVVEGQFVK